MVDMLTQFGDDIKNFQDSKHNCIGVYSGFIHKNTWFKSNKGCMSSDI